MQPFTPILSALCAEGGADEFTALNVTENLNGDCKEAAILFCKKGGKQIFGAAVLPKNYAEGEKLSTVILSHGFGGRHSDELEKARMLTKAGYACFCFDFGGINK